VDRLPDQLRALKDRFDAAHEDGMAALLRGDYAEFAHAIQRERDILDERTALLAEWARILGLPNGTQSP